MRVNPIKNNNRDYVTAGVLGAMGGITLKNVLPLSEYERNEFFTPEVLDLLQETEESVKSAEFDSIVIGAKEGSEEIADDVLQAFKMNKENILDDKIDEFTKSISGFDARIQDGVKKLAKRVKNSGLEAKKNQSKTVEVLAKNSRPVSYFIIIASAVLLSCAVLKNHLYKNMDGNNEQKSLDYSA